ncbi:nucleotide exchange factor GrpE [Saccharopolyspora griseoalba]|uniref:Nucleotide exchange factor GrpE n=1 Tax=Saccharopolyspora griseoalba TaxID=1431848 RepID=A0ABW2LMM9_9PSEU
MQEEGTTVASDADAELGTDMIAVTSESGALEHALTERAKLIELCVYAVDRARSAGVAQRLVEGLREIGVSALRPDGERFDPVRHEAGGTLPTDDPSLDGTIAETEVPGFADRAQVLRAPVVTVYQLR